jgi:Tfp pilus assembly protein PilE
MFQSFTTDNAPTPKKSKKAWVIAIIILILLLLLAIFGLPRYNKYLMKGRSANGKAGVEAIKTRVDEYWKTNGNMGGFTIENALAETQLSNKIKRQWHFFIAWKSTQLYTTEMVDKLKNVNANEYVFIAPYKVIMAVATKDNPLKEGTKIWFEGDANSFHGYGIDGRVEPDWGVLFPNP